MPKKMKGENSKAVDARARKAEAKAVAASQKEKEVEDAYWKDDDKHVNRKMQRKAGKEQKRQEELAKKQEKKKLLEEEESSIKVKTPSGKGGSAKMTRAQVEANRERMEQERAEAGAESKKQASHLDAPLEENVNIRLAQDQQDGVVSARDVGEAISALSLKEAELEKHPEKRVKAAYAAYEETQLPILKAENPNLRLSQLKQMLKKDWMKSPENPMNQRFHNYNAKK
ncbi:coiled-coil domain-containing protein 124-like [Lytechinus pictus]|uniref:coiled-coil domain-containing protein 124-like n=1 Tax=Lytechinus pictus TaxID=7653 RepID=UPI00240E7DA8|nr:coiled-coil domain-containing protein 124-like [Lytechinus pictus]